ncbi:dTDP-4-amino-4,6-dideoxygalactose transaminase [Algoriphagus halophytocola]|uniref:dTDP-4-amino-4,6-dideoxygalactose transaminase n=1 Tax=Algoriphagus halophytocola TaxID=2991499 RepID=A0ABY6MP27_9BACT|nr:MULTISPECIES: dTDP-4-amino-4,6-dideoxygalactose transaminase [unclassified Algoriphagus]UZD23949.1 dTDP-4-amino-4,6-dideoxygalactose transaminase [Algoriphagus sp. TR-M5]WBL41320.1 dTDP-4-amino-4,6-dideoxygalactose transaminase [Algoriphagus sp. TR-M9]
MQTPFNKPYQTGKELTYIQDAIQRGKISGNGHYTQLCQEFFERSFGFEKCLLTTSCTDALEMAAILLDIQPGDEVIMPAFTFVSTANAFVLRGAKIVFVDSRTDHPNMDETLIENLITPHTKAIVAVHYAGKACEMDLIMDIAYRYGLFVVEDAAQAITSYYKGKALGSIGHLGCMSFHETKNIQCGEGGMLIINDPQFTKRAEIIWEKGTNRAAFFRGEIDQYNWVDIGSSFLPSELNAAYLWAQIEHIDLIQERRKIIWQDYYQFFVRSGRAAAALQTEYLGKFTEVLDQLQLWESYGFPTQEDSPNAHSFYLLFQNLNTRARFISQMLEKGILCVFHYQNLQDSPYYQSISEDQRILPNAVHYSACLVRLPLFYELGY